MNNRPRVSFPTLDTLRALCFLLVFFFHGFHSDDPSITGDGVWRTVKFGLFGNGNMGVNIFFVLSGFLITYLLIVEQAFTKRVHVPRFWLRRALRIWPLYYSCLAFGFWVFPWIKSQLGGLPNESADPLYYLVFLGNFDFLRHGLPDASILAVLWSIAVEEQFYLFWPVIMAVVPTRWYWAVFGAILLQSWLFRGYNTSALAHEIHTLSCIGDMAMGAFAALLVSSSRGAAWVGRWSKGSVVAIYLLFALCYFFRTELLLGSSALRIFERSILAFLVAGILLHQTHGQGRFMKLPSNGPLAALGRISFGLYCLHMVGILTAIQVLHHFALDTKVWQVLALQPLLALAITIALASLSYRLLEHPFLMIKHRFSYVSRN